MKEKVKTKIVLEIENYLIDILNKHQYQLIDIDISGGKNKHICIYVYNNKITDLDHLSELSKIIHPVLLDKPNIGDDFTLEISSPGIYRKIKYKKEFDIFINRKIKIVKNDGNTVTGISNGLSNDSVLIKNKNQIKIKLSDIKIAKLNG